MCDEVENLLANDSGDAEYRACEHVLGEGFDKTETWIIKSMFTANHESRTVEHPETFSSEQEAWNRVKSFALADQNDKEVAEVRYNKDACEAMVIYSDKTFCKFFAEKRMPLKLCLWTEIPGKSRKRLPLNSEHIDSPVITGQPVS